MVLKNLFTSELGKQTTKKLLKEVDKRILNKGTIKNPEKLLQKVEDVTVGDEAVKVGPNPTSTTVKIKDFKGSDKKLADKVSKETMDEFLASFNSGTIPKKILADFHIDKISKNDDIIQMINGIAKGYKPSEIVKQTRGTIKQSSTKASGTKLSRNEDFLLEVLGTKPGTAYNASQIYGMRQLLEAGAARMRYLASKAADLDSASNVDILKFRQHYALMAQIQKVLIGVKTETGRALNQFKIASDASKKYSFLGGSVDDLNRQNLIVEHGGFDEIQKVAELVLSTKRNTALLAANNRTGLKTFSQKTSNAMAEVFINAILSNPLTHVRNGAGNWISQAIVQQERKFAARFFGGKNEGGVAAYEDVAKAWGKHQAAKEIMAAMQNVYKLGGSKIETRLGRVTADEFGIKNKVGAKLFDIAGKGVTLGNLPTKFLKVSDDYFKNREFRSELYAMAFRDGMEMYNKKLLKEADLPQYIASKVANPSKDLVDAAYKQAQYVTFQTPLGTRGDIFDLGKIAQQGKNYAENRGPFSVIMNYYLPFVQTPTNIAGFVAERTPVLAQVLTKYNAKIKAGGAVADKARAQLYLGSLFYMASAPLGYYGVGRDKAENFLGTELPQTYGSDIRQDGQLTGGKNLLQKTTKTQPFQIEIPLGDGKFQKISFRSFDPVAQIFANSANFGQYVTLMEGSLRNNLGGDEKQYKQLGKDSLAYLIAYSFSIGENLSNSTMLAGAGKLVDDVRSISRGVQSDNKTKAVIEVGSEFASSFIPTVAKQIGNVLNSDTQKLVTEFNEYFKKSIAEGSLVEDVDLRGREYKKFEYFNQHKRDYIDDELFDVQPSITPVKNYIRYDYAPDLGLGVSVPLNSKQKRFLRKNSGVIFDKKMKALYEAPHYKNETRKMIKESLIRQEWQDAKSDAKKFLLNPNEGYYEQQNDKGEIERITYLSEIKSKAEDLRDSEIANSQMGYVNQNIEE